MQVMPAMVANLPLRTTVQSSLGSARQHQRSDPCRTRSGLSKEQHLCLQEVAMGEVSQAIMLPTPQHL